LHPNCPQALALTPWAGFAPALNHSDRAEARYVLVAQPRCSRLGRSLGLSSHLQSDKVLRQTAPIEPDEHVSVRPGSTSQYRGRWLVCPPGPVGETGFVGWYCLPGSVSKAFHVPDNSGPPSWIAAGGRYQRTGMITKERAAVRSLPAGRTAMGPTPGLPHAMAPRGKRRIWRTKSEEE